MNDEEKEGERRRNREKKGEWTMRRGEQGEGKGGDEKKMVGGRMRREPERGNDKVNRERRTKDRRGRRRRKSQRCSDGKYREEMKQKRRVGGHENTRENKCRI